MRKAIKLLGWKEECSFNFAKFHFESARFFERNKALEHETRINNISDLSKALTRSCIKNWLQGKTLIGFTAYRGYLIIR